MRKINSVAVVASLVSAIAAVALTFALTKSFERWSAARVADRPIPAGAELIGTSNLSIGLAGHGYRSWVFSMPDGQWEREFSGCDRMRLTRGDLVTYQLLPLFSEGQEVCFGIPQKEPGFVRAWFASDAIFAVFVSTG